MSVQTDQAMWLHAPNLRASHGFSTRQGGVSGSPFDSLNLDDRQDDPARVAENRRRALGRLGFDPERSAHLDQVHGTRVVHARSGIQTGDALVTSELDLLLTIMTADCYPILLEDSHAGVIGAAHAGWRGTLGRIAAATVQAMTGLGADRKRIQVAIGPGICARQYAVGSDVVRAVTEAGLGEALLDIGGTTHLDLLSANISVLCDAGIERPHIWAAGRCSTEAAFFSFRRDAGRTGRMWAVIGRHKNLMRTSS
ncbi:peptidoglycan editing factor PgeF [Deinococcus peraridilitoris]|uniref:Purine nucleoside phosphorylase n=1 Tax=Deinococcus peraridilitoris (strain DSM 19664 / LMG 22246 / CIP 109416 / KR-200) TaxID=937777 RepID=L0A186_DEIPD|nr:peptidoglycan editing factor PgeF [Deinococcus peraridilitoris]AFZ67643.1 uncharacterized protein, YfiH family [Deinococcus peraridilitoris DSM 19664]